jgi:hypothetical protein
MSSRPPLHCAPPRLSSTTASTSGLPARHRNASRSGLVQAGYCVVIRGSIGTGPATGFPRCRICTHSPRSTNSNPKCRREIHSGAVPEWPCKVFPAVHFIAVGKPMLVRVAFGYVHRSGTMKPQWHDNPATLPSAGPTVPHAALRRRFPARSRACRAASLPAPHAFSLTCSCAAACLASPQGRPSAPHCSPRWKCVARRGATRCAGSPRSSGRPNPAAHGAEGSANPRSQRDHAARSISRCAIPSSR